MGGIDGLKSIFHLGHGSLALFILYSIIIYMLYILGGLIIFRAIPETAHLGFAAAFVLSVWIVCDIFRQDSRLRRKSEK